MRKTVSVDPPLPTHAQIHTPASYTCALARTRQRHLTKRVLHVCSGLRISSDKFYTAQRCHCPCSQIPSYLSLTVTPTNQSLGFNKSLRLLSVAGWALPHVSFQLLWRYRAAWGATSLSCSDPRKSPQERPKPWSFQLFLRCISYLSILNTRQK